MASNEGQTKAILIVVNLLLLSVAFGTAWHFYAKSDLLTKSEAEQKKAAQDAKAAKNIVDSEYSELRENALGLGESASHSSIVELIKKRLAEIRTKLDGRIEKSTALPEEAFTYDSATTYLLKELAAGDDRIGTLQTQYAALQKELKDLEGKTNSTIGIASKAKDAALAELETQTKTLEGVINEKDEEIRQIQDAYAKVRTELQQLGRDSKDTIERMETQQKNLQFALNELRLQQDREKAWQFDGADGQVISVVNSQATSADVTVDLGIADGIRTGINFAVWGRDRGGNRMAEPKARMEIVSVLDDGTSVGRVTFKDVTSNPVLPGDIIQNPVWDRGDKEGVGIVGLVHLDLDGDWDNVAFRRYIERQGGKVDAYVDLELGVTTGAISTKTAYLIEGDIPDPADFPNDPDMMRIITILNAERGKLIRQADSISVRRIPVRKFLTYMGHNIPHDSVVAGEEYKVMRIRRGLRTADQPAPGTKYNGSLGGR